MSVSRSIRTGAVLSALVIALCSTEVPARPDSGTAATGSQAAEQDGRKDFDWDIGSWKTHQRRLLHPLTGSTSWIEYQGTDVVRKIWDGANWGMVEADGPSGHLEIYTIRLYNPGTREWTINFTNPAAGALGVPLVGRFKAGQGEFYDQEVYNGRTIFVRFRISGITADSRRFEQAFSADGGKTWETNFIVTETRVPDAPGKAQPVA